MKRILDLALTLPGVLLLLPVFLFIAVWIKLDSRGPVFFRQERVGRGQRPFWIYKFRTMVVDAEKLGMQVTVGRDPRITASGHFLRRYKLDELPQLFNVLLGDMSLVGPRPEVPRYVSCYPPQDRELIFRQRPGITDYASIYYRDENRLLGEANDPEATYINEVLPAKLEYYREYAQNRNLLEDIKIIWLTIKAILYG